MQTVARIVDAHDGSSPKRRGMMRMWPEAMMHAPRTIRKSFLDLE
jgi:hypothetical protein